MLTHCSGTNLAILNGVDGLLRNAFASGVLRADLAHGHKPLVGQHGFDDLACACANGRHHFVGLDVDDVVASLQVGQKGFASVVAVKPTVLGRTVVVHMRIERENGDERQVVPHGACIVVEVVSACDFDATRSEFAIDKIVSDDGNGAIAQGQLDPLTHQMFVAIVFGMNRQCTVGHHGFGTRGGNGHATLQLAIDHLWAVHERVANVVHATVGFDVFDFQVGHRCFEHRVPVDQSLTAVNQALFIQAHKGFGDHLGQLVVHGEVFAAPIDAGPHAAHLRGDRVARLFFPFPHTSDEVFARFGFGRAHVVTRQALALQLTLDHDLCGNASVIGAGNPGCVVPQHAVVAREAVHDRLVERMTHVQRARDVGWGQLNGKRRSVGIALACATHACSTVGATLPFGTPLGFDGRGFKRFGQTGQTGLFGCAHGARVSMMGQTHHFTGARRLNTKR